ncbi:DJ-1/PfpI family protein [Bacillus sp. 31A1R]|uniref:DJ-1/PfpI family protein n=1 Tax=Robertmurraya mangrovi TaxID=3098077 RepID=A0ABU5J117_9BACI|nr:DJ-1/PfpI family protein [Bacillus sp. 31A1R]MDZ5473056.1 DJ-1/PfpI family protein [Bacillus sp. 31A1R]
MKKTAVLLFPLFSEYEISVALSILMQGNKPVVTVGMSKGPIKGEASLSCVADLTIDEINFNEIDSLLIPGCMDISTIMNEEKLIHFIKEIASENRVIASISSSPLLLAKAGVLKGKKFTVGLTEEFMIETGSFEMENLSKELVVRDGNLLTARGRGFIDFGVTFGHMLHLNFDKAWY